MSARRKVKERPRPFDALDAAVMDRFPSVQCETQYSIFSMNHITSWWVAGTEDVKLKPALARQVREFVAGFMSGFDAALPPQQGG